MNHAAVPGNAVSLPVGAASHLLRHASHALGFILIAFLAPDLYISVTNHREDWTSIAGVSRSIKSINGLTQTNAQRIQVIAESSRSLVDMVSALSREIEEFERKNTAVSR